MSHKKTHGDISLWDTSLSMEIPHAPEHFLFKYLKNDAGSRDLAVDGSTPVAFKYTCPKGKTALISRLNLFIVDGAIQPTKFGGLAALTNGVAFQVVNPYGTIDVDFTAGYPIKMNNEFGLLTGIDSVLDTAAGDDVFNARWTITRAGGPLLLSENHSIQAIIQDDISELTFFYIMVQGLIHDKIEIWT